jgi:signal peptidase
MKIRDKLREDLHLPGFVSDILYVAVVIGVISAVSQLALGLWTPMVAVESGSMVPNLNIGDIVVVQGASRTEVTPWDVAQTKGYTAFNNPGDVILYLPYGKERLGLIDQAKAILGVPYPPEKATPIIHRALRFVNESQPMWDGGPKAPFSGYITKGDHNDRIDQVAGAILGIANVTYIKRHQDQLIVIKPDSMYIEKSTGVIIYKSPPTDLSFLSLKNGTYVGEGISYLTPVKKEWVIGVAKVRIPIVGYVRLIPNIIGDEIHKLLGGS